MDQTSSRPSQRIGDYLVDRGLASRDAVEAAVRESRITSERIGNILVRNGFLRYSDLVKAILSLSPDNIVFEKSFTGRIPMQLLEEHSIVVVAETKEDLYVSTLSRQEVVENIIERYYPDKKINFVALSPSDLNTFMEGVTTQGDDSAEAEDESDDALVLDMILKKAILVGASDIHIEPRYQSFTVFFRHLGIRKIVHEGSLEQHGVMTSQIKDRSRMDQVETRIPQDGGFNIEFRGRLVDLRVATVPSVNGEIVVIRLLDPDKAQKTLNDLGVTRVDEWRSATSYPFGLCLVCGATGSGKTTTLNSTIREMDRFGMSIKSVEDPVEYRIPYVGQVNVNNVVGLDFSTALRSFMRADPDVIILGEIRDFETAKLVIRAAETGHLVLATLHTGSVQGSMSRLKTLGVEEEDLIPLLRGVLVQRLMRTLCEACGGEGCGICLETGYAGRTVVSECALLRNEDEVRRAFKGERLWPTMIEDALHKIDSGITSVQEVYRVFKSEIDNQMGQSKDMKRLMAMVDESQGRKQYQDFAAHKDPQPQPNPSSSGGHSHAPKTETVQSQRPAAPVPNSAAKPSATASSAAESSAPISPLSSLSPQDLKFWEEERKLLNDIGYTEFPSGDHDKEKKE